MSILVLDDEPHGAKIVKLLSKKGLPAEHVRRGSDAIAAFNKEPGRWSGIVVDLRLRAVDGMQPDGFMGRRNAGLLVLEKLRMDGFQGKAVVLASIVKDCSPSDCERLDITSALSKVEPYGPQKLAVELVRVLYPSLWQEREKLVADVLLDQLPDLQPVLSQIRENAYFDGNTLLVGEPGVGKEALCRYFFVHSGRLGTFVAVPGAVLAGDGMRVTLCGQAKGFPQPNSAGRPGAFEQAGFGVVYIGELDKYMESQGCDLAPLFTATDERYVSRVSSTTNLPVQCAIVASANNLKNIGKAIKTRFDIIEVPPLRRRPGDVRALASRLRERFLDEWAVFNPTWEVTDERLEALVRHPLPGNIRSIDRWARSRNGVLHEAGTTDDDQLAPDSPRVDPPDALTLTVKLVNGKAAYSDYFGNLGSLKRQYWAWLGNRVGFKMEELRRASGQNARDIKKAVTIYDLPLEGALDEDSDEPEGR